MRRNTPSRMRYLIALLLTTLSLPAAKSTSYQSDWKGSRIWVGPDWWANPMPQWSVRKGSAVAAAAKDRTLCLLPADVGEYGKSFSASIKVKALDKTKPKSRSAGFRIGRRGGIDDYRHALVHATDWIDAKIREDGHLVLGESVSKKQMAWGKNEVSLILTGHREGDTVKLKLTASVADSDLSLIGSFSTQEVTGGISVLADGPRLGVGSKPAQRFAFREFQLSGDMIRHHEDRSFGPILWTQYTLSEKRLRLQAQFAPLKRTDREAELWISGKLVATSPVDLPSRTATFTVDDWDGTKTEPYQVRFMWRHQRYEWNGKIRSEPKPDEPLKLASFSCDNGYLFPIPVMVEQVKRQDPDMLFFAGDQIYESYGGFGVMRSHDTETAMVDFLRKFYQFGWTWRELLRDRPSVILTDDHDVFQGNIWGHGGRKLPQREKPDWTLGGYLMPADWVNAVEKTHVGHLPDPAVDIALPLGIKPYFTDMTYGGIGFAILEDRKFKTGPKTLPREKQKNGEGADLLGEHQEAFLKRWSNDWKGQRIKCALSQTIFCTAATHTGQSLKRSPFYYDSGAWPKAARNRAVRILGDCNALSIHGDQHLGVLLRQGVKEFDDAGYAFMVPGTANGFPRAWWPGVKKGEQPQPDQNYTGKFHDDAGHPIRVLAVGNPEPGSNLLKSVDPMEIGYRKGSGYGIVEFNKRNQTAKISLYRLGNRDEQFPGFPKTIPVGGRPR